MYTGTESGRNGFSEAAEPLAEWGPGPKSQLRLHRQSSSLSLLTAEIWERSSAVMCWDKCRLICIRKASCTAACGLLLPLTYSGDLLIELFWIPFFHGRIHLGWAEKSLSWAPHIQESPQRGWHAGLLGCYICKRVKCQPSFAPPSLWSKRGRLNSKNHTDLGGVAVLTGVHLCISARKDDRATPTRAGHLQVTSLSTLPRASLWVPPSWLTAWGILG